MKTPVRIVAAMVVGLWAAIGLATATWAQDASVQQWTAQLRSPDVLVRKAAADALGKAGAEAQAAVPALVGALGDPERDVRSAAAWALAFIHTDAPRAVPALIKTLADRDEFVRAAATEGLAAYGPEAAQAVPELTKALHDTAWAVRAGAARALGQIGPAARPTAAQIIGLLKDAEPFVRSAAAIALADLRCDGKTAVPALIKAMDDSDPMVRRSVVAGLGAFGGIAAKTALTKARESDADAEVRQAAAQTLEYLPPAAGEEAGPAEPPAATAGTPGGAERPQPAQPEPGPAQPGQPAQAQGPAVAGGATKLEYVDWSDPNEGAFSVRVPRGWKVQGGCTRRRALAVFTTLSVELTSPDQAIHVLMVYNEPAMTTPHPTLDMVGLHEGGLYPDGSGGGSLIWHYTPGAHYVTEFLLPKRGITQFQVTNIRPWDELARKMVVIPGFDRVDAGEVAYTFAQGKYRGGALAVTRLIQSQVGGPGTWHLEYVYLYESPENRQADARSALLHVMYSFRINPQWAQALDAAIKKQVGIITDLGNSTSQIITDTFNNRQSTLDRIFLNGSDVRRGQARLFDPVNQIDETVDNKWNYYWKNNRGEIRGTDTDQPPSYQDEWRKMIMVSPEWQ